MAWSNRSFLSFFALLFVLVNNAKVNSALRHKQQSAALSPTLSPRETQAKHNSLASSSSSSPSFDTPTLTDSSTQYDASSLAAIRSKRHHKSTLYHNNQAHTQTQAQTQAQPQTTPGANMASTDGPVSATTTSDTLGFSTPVFAEAKSDGGPVNLLQSKSQSQSTQTAAAAASASAATTAAAQQMQYITLASTGTAKSQAEAKSSSSSRSPHDHKHDVLGSNFADVQYKDTIRCPAANVEEVRSDNFIDALAGQPTVVMFYGPECVHTNSFTPVYECVAAALPSIKFIKMSSTESISRKYAKATPTVRFFNGKPKYEQDLGLIYKGNPEIPALKHFCKSSAGRYGHDVVIKSSDETQVNLDGGQTHHVLGREHTTREGIDSVTTTITPSLSSSVGSDLHHHGAHHHRHLHSNGEALTREDYVEDAYDHAHAHGHSHHGHHNTVRISDAEEDMMLDTHSLMETGESMTALLRGMAPSCTCDLE